MAVDNIRSCYTTKVRFFKDNPLEVTIRWFFCKPEAKDFPHYTRFASGNWSLDHPPWDGPGEVQGAARTWSNGATPSWADGQHFCGNVDWWRDGVPFSAYCFPFYPDGEPLCCRGNPPPHWCAGGGAEVGGEATMFPCFTGVTCAGHTLPCALYCLAVAVGDSQILGAQSFRIFWDGAEWRGVHGGFDLHFGVFLGPCSTFFARSTGACIVPLTIGAPGSLNPFFWIEGNAVTPSASCIDDSATFIQFEITERQQWLLPARGGVSMGGASQFAPFVSATGGVEVGGAGEFSPFLSATGGVEVGGEGTNPEPYPAGGVEVGGEANQYVDGSVLATGGVEVGGEADFS